MPDLQFRNDFHYRLQSLQIFFSLPSSLYLLQTAVGAGPSRRPPPPPHVVGPGSGQRCVTAWPRPRSATSRRTLIGLSAAEQRAKDGRYVLSVASDSLNELASSCRHVILIKSCSNFQAKYRRDKPEREARLQAEADAVALAKETAHVRR